MTKKERMLAAFRHEPVDRIPAGELSIHQNLAARILGRPAPAAADGPEAEYRLMRDFCEEMEMDTIVIGSWPSWSVGTTQDGHPLFQNVYGCT